MEINRMRLDTPIGALYLEEIDGAVTRITVDALEITGSASPVLSLAARELEEYFAGTRQAFTMPIRPAGTAFQQAVWAALREIPYGEIAAAVGRPKASRAVGGANHVNPILIVTPCHRVIGANGSLTGFGAGIDRKAFLLDLEGKVRAF